MTIEWAISLPLLLMLIFGAAEIARYIQIIQKVDKTAYTMADLVSAAAPIGPKALSEGRLLAILQRMESLMAPYNTKGKAGVMVSSVIREEGAASTPRIAWSMGYSDDSEHSFKSVVSGIGLQGSLNAVGGMPASFSNVVQAKLSDYGGMRENENFIAVEVGYYYEPMLGQVLNMFGLDMFGEHLIRRDAFFKPRYGHLLYLPPIIMPE
ncbi:MAG: pilus assembly protein [Rickettsiales bacterium]|nr:pilus assembly protein [Rickettsiales bacterium]